MTDSVPTQIYRVFDPATRVLTPLRNRFSGQVGDSYSTRLHFEYPTGWLDGKKPFIIFDVKDDLGNTIMYDPDSDDAFDGTTFDIPWEVTHRAVNNRLSYQLAFVKNTTTTEPDGTVRLDQTAATISQVDTLKLSDSVSQSLVDSVAQLTTIDSTFTSESPTLWGWVEYFKNYGFIKPVTYDNEQTLSFKTYNGTYDMSIDLNMPYLDENGFIVKAFIDPIYQLYSNLVTAWQETPDDDHYPSEKLTKDSLDLKTDGTLAVWPWNAELTYSAGSPVVEGNYIYLSLISSNVGNDPAADDPLVPTHWVRLEIATDIVTAWQGVTSDLKIPSEKLTKATLDEKTDGTMAIWAWSPALTYSVGSAVIYGNYEYISLVDSNLNIAPGTDPGSWRRQMSYTEIVSAWGTVLSDTKVPSEKLVRNWFDLYTLGIDGLWAWDSGKTYHDSSVITDNYTIYISLADGNIGHDPLEGGSVWWTKIEGGGGGGSGGTSIVTRMLGNGTDTSFTVTHGFGSRNFVYSIRYNDDTNARYTDAVVTASTLNTCTVSFTAAPALNQFVLVLIPGGGTLADSGQYTFEQTTASTLWTIPHNLDKVVTVQTYDSDGNQIIGDLQLVDTNNCTVTFTEAETGTAAVR